MSDMGRPSAYDEVLAETSERRARLAAQTRLERARVLVEQAEADLVAQLAMVRRMRALPAEERRTTRFDPADAQRLERVHAELEGLRRRPHRGRSGRVVAKRALALELTQRLILERMGLQAYEQYLAICAAPPSDVIDLAYLEYAREELARAEQAWRAFSHEGVDLPRRAPHPR